MSSIPQKRLLIIGRTNAGKTLFLLNFAQYMGYSELVIKLKHNSGDMDKSDSINNLKSTLVNSTPNTTRCLQIASVAIPVYKGSKYIELWDSTGISSAINFEQETRDGMVQTLALLKENYFILHIVDAAILSQENKIDEVDMELYRYGRKRGNYLVLANKSDQKEFEKGFELISKTFTDIRVIKISALLKEGFNEVKRYVSRIS